ncbi:hypothetical protein [Gardnerella sp. Marseille-Q2328]|uniref:hypothetical protein n=1 Tax=Gardnerella sp. Marseille-Q2328 TaxID=2759694 RepID=UPI0020256DB5|nr:hypothetical protein [Gardnerella sp. Marseille-Q2328]
MLKFTKQQVLTVRRSTGAKLHEHLREKLRQMLLFWWFFGTFAGKSPVFVAVLVVFWNICGKNSGKCCCFGGFLEHLRENLRYLLLNWWFCGTFAGIFPVFVVVLAVFWNICRKIVGRLSLFLSVVLGW